MRLENQHRYVRNAAAGGFAAPALLQLILAASAGLPHTAGWIAGRRRNAARYRTQFAEAGLAAVVELPGALPGRGHTFNQFVIRAPRRDELKAHLLAKGIGCSVYYPLPLHLQPCFRHLGQREGECPVAERASHEVLALPVFPELTDAELVEVVSVIADFYRED